MLIAASDVDNSILERCYCNRSTRYFNALCPTPFRLSLAHQNWPERAGPLFNSFSTGRVGPNPKRAGPTSTGPCRPLLCTHMAYSSYTYILISQCYLGYVTLITNKKMQALTWCLVLSNGALKRCSLHISFYRRSLSPHGFIVIALQRVRCYLALVV